MESQIDDMQTQLQELETLYGEMDEDSAHAKRLESILTKLEAISSDMIDVADTERREYQDKEASCSGMRDALERSRVYLEDIWREQMVGAGVSPDVDGLLAELDDALDIQE